MASVGVYGTLDATSHGAVALVHVVATVAMAFTAFSYGEDGLRRPARVALLCAAGIILVAAVWAARRDDGMDHLVSGVDIGALTAVTLLHASVLGWFAVRGRDGPVVWWRHVLVPAVGAVIVAASGAAQVVGAVWFLLGLGVLVAQRSR